MKHESSFIGVGLYTVEEAEALIGVPRRTLRRWLGGRRERNLFHEPLWTSQVALDDDEVYLGFRDLIQARVVERITREGLPANKVREAIRLAQEILASDHPLASGRFKTDGKTLLLDIISRDNDPETTRLTDLFRKGQYVMRHIIEPTLRDVEHDADHAPTRWWVAGSAGRIVIDPARQFGAPIDDETGVPAQVLANAVAREGGAARVAALYQVPLAAVQAAQRFQATLDRRSSETRCETR